MISEMSMPRETKRRALRARVLRGTLASYGVDAVLLGGLPSPVPSRRGRQYSMPGPAGSPREPSMRCAADRASPSPVIRISWSRISSLRH